MTEDVRERLLSRKFLLALLIQLTSTGLLLHGNLGGGEYVTITLGIAGAYMGTNAWGKDR